MQVIEALVGPLPVDMAGGRVLPPGGGAAFAAQFAALAAAPTAGTSVATPDAAARDGAPAPSLAEMSAAGLPAGVERVLPEDPRTMSTSSPALPDTVPIRLDGSPRAAAESRETDGAPPGPVAVPSEAERTVRPSTLPVAPAVASEVGGPAIALDGGQRREVVPRQAEPAPDDDRASADRQVPVRTSASSSATGESTPGLADRPLSGGDEAVRAVSVDAWPVGISMVPLVGPDVGPQESQLRGLAPTALVEAAGPTTAVPTSGEPSSRGPADRTVRTPGEGMGDGRGPAGRPSEATPGRDAWGEARAAPDAAATRDEQVGAAPPDDGAPNAPERRTDREGTVVRTAEGPRLQAAEAAQAGTSTPGGESGPDAGRRPPLREGELSGREPGPGVGRPAEPGMRLAEGRDPPLPGPPMNADASSKVHPTGDGVAETAQDDGHARATPAVVAAGDVALHPPPPEVTGDVPSTRATAATASPPQAPLPSAPASEPARAVADQLAAAVRSTPDGTIEIQLAPEELGRVTLAMQAGDGTLAVTIEAERPETLELLRRNIDILAREFRDQGFASLDLSFGPGTGDPSRGPVPDASEPTRAEGRPPSPAEPGARTAAPSGRLDLRL